MKKSLVALVLVLAGTMCAQDGQQPQTAPAGEQAQPQQQQKKIIKDPAEYNAYITAVNQQQPAAKAQAFEAFLQQYPNSVMKEDALEQLMAAYGAAGDKQKTDDAANRLLQQNPCNLRALALLTFNERAAAEQGGANAAQSLTQAGQHANKGMECSQTAQMPEGTTQADWDKLKQQTTLIFGGAAGMAALQAKDYPTAQKDLQAAVEASPNDLRNVYPLALAYLSPKPIDIKGIWYIARAVNLAQGSPAQAQINAYGKSAYTKYHGGDDGWDQLVQQAASSPNPPADFAIKPAPTPAEQAAVMVQSTPVDKMSFDQFQLIFTSGNQQAADQVWTGIKDKPIAFAASVVSATRDKLMLASTADDIQSNTADVELTMATPLTVAKVPKAGAQVQVIGTPTTYDVQPFMIHMEKGAFYGQKPEPAATKKPPARRTPRHRPQ